MTEAFHAERMVRLRWACRRTLQVLDRPLGNFLHDCFADLDMGEQFAFERLLKAKDQEILDWLIGNRESRDAGICAIIAKIRAHDDNSSGDNNHV
ncbi:MAG TPA: succinate dehydrogenase assembly factor 2 [Candidatus Thiothrix moscowensis]|uniref:FAD assembly factor SdhE n=1 Tax=unclassified Thiothrix TaxID=2636184 RepID=UPI001A19A4F9|nr:MULTISPECIES: succinate dehydrogenase assembly factor 2 [unclassified Thiothrix]MBJ6610068.1 succinate dehydrogenase assembly factor 2 [Candidatus Thiothrix moscowensis]HRJ54320.1 succinate dehydrogenase assembly factor 2 [Candidatus Thiothrix moscowensis]HRJ94605.1 succinate dehydrogenase assembly factor 2 [Candidatus Thiothrix moscowensis]